MREKENCVRRVPHHRAFLTHECEICTGVYWDGGHKKRFAHTGVFYVVNTHGFSGDVNQFGEMACSATTPPLEINQFIPGQKGRVKMSIPTQRKFQKKKIQM